MTYSLSIHSFIRLRNHLGHHDAVDHGPEDHEDGYEEQLRRAGRGNVAKADGREDRVYEIDTWAVFIGPVDP